jgi:hypothetical protein
MIMPIKEREQSRFLFYGMLLYLCISYSQIAGRYPFLSPLRVEFLVGLLLLVIIGFKILKKEIIIGENQVNYAVILFMIACGITIHLAFVKTRPPPKATGPPKSLKYTFDYSTSHLPAFDKWLYRPSIRGDLPL